MTVTLSGPQTGPPLVTQLDAEQRNCIDTSQQARREIARHEWATEVLSGEPHGSSDLQISYLMLKLKLKLKLTVSVRYLLTMVEAKTMRSNVDTDPTLSPYVMICLSSCICV